MTITLTGIPTPENTADFLAAEKRLINSIPNIEVNNPVHNNSVIYYAHNIREWDTLRADSLRIREMIIQICESDCILMLSGMIMKDDVGIVRVPGIIAEILKIPVYTSVDECIDALSSGGGTPVLEAVSESESGFLWCEGCSITGDYPVEHDKDDLVCQDKPIPGCDLYRSYEDAAEGDPERAIQTES